MVKRVVSVSRYKRKGRWVSGYDTLRDTDRGSLGRKQSFPYTQKTISTKDALGRFTGRRRTTSGEKSDTTGILREMSKGRVIGRTKAFKRK